MTLTMKSESNLSVFEACQIEISDKEDTLKLLQCISYQLESDQEVTREKMRSYLLLLRYVSQFTAYKEQEIILQPR